MNCVFSLIQNSLWIWSLDSWGMGNRDWPAQEVPLALGLRAMAFPQRHTRSVAQELKSPSFLAGRLRGHLIALSHFTDEEMRPRSVKSTSLLLSQLVLDRTRTRVRAHPTSPFLYPFLRLWCSCWNLRRQMFLLASFQLGELSGFKCQIYFYVTPCVYWTIQHHI